MEIDPALMNAVQNVRSAIAIEIHDVSESPLIAGWRLMENRLPRAEDALIGTEKLRIALVLVELHSEPMHQIKMAVPIPVHQLRSPSVQRSGVPLAGQRRCVLPQG